MSERWNFGRARKGRPVIAYRDAGITSRGRRWTGTWHVENGELVLSSAWGSRSAPAAPDESTEALAARARVMLEQMIETRDAAPT
jgi:hypothetical protein